MNATLECPRRSDTRHAAFQRRQAELERRREREYRRAISKGGDIAREAKWQRASDEAADRNVALCQWQNESDVHVCYRREAFAGGVYRKAPLRPGRSRVAEAGQGASDAMSRSRSEGGRRWTRT